MTAATVAVSAALVAPATVAVTARARMGGGPGSVAEAASAAVVIIVTAAEGGDSAPATAGTGHVINVIVRITASTTGGEATNHVRQRINECPHGGKVQGIEQQAKSSPSSNERVASRTLSDRLRMKRAAGGEREGGMIWHKNCGSSLNVFA